MRLKTYHLAGIVKCLETRDSPRVAFSKGPQSLGLLCASCILPSSQPTCPGPDPLASLEHTRWPNFSPSDAGFGLGVEQPKILHLGVVVPWETEVSKALCGGWRGVGWGFNAMNTSFPEASVLGPL